MYMLGKKCMAAIREQCHLSAIKHKMAQVPEPVEEYREETPEEYSFAEQECILDLVSDLIMVRLTKEEQERYMEQTFVKIPSTAETFKKMGSSVRSRRHFVPKGIRIVPHTSDEFAEAVAKAGGRIVE
jgi:hypothetical protein